MILAGERARHLRQKTTWRQWSDTQDNDPEYYQQAIARHYFSVVAEVRSGKTVFYVWEYLGRV